MDNLARDWVRRFTRLKSYSHLKFLQFTSLKLYYAANTHTDTFVVLFSECIIFHFVFHFHFLFYRSLRNLHPFGLNLTVVVKYMLLMCCVFLSRFCSRWWRSHWLCIYGRYMWWCNAISLTSYFLIFFFLTWELRVYRKWKYHNICILRQSRGKLYRHFEKFYNTIFWKIANIRNVVIYLEILIFFSICVFFVIFIERLRFFFI